MTLQQKLDCMDLLNRQVYIVIIVFYLKEDLFINGNKHELMIIKELLKGPVGGLLYCPQYHQMLVITRTCF